MSERDGKWEHAKKQFIERYGPNLVRNKDELAIAQGVRAFTKWWFDLLKNLLLLVALGTFSSRANSWALTGAYYFSWILFVSYTYSYFEGTYFYPWIDTKRPRLSIWTSVAVAAILSTGLLIGVQAAVQLTFRSLSDLQSVCGK